MRSIVSILLLLNLVACFAANANDIETTLRIALFNADVSPPIGSPVAYAPTRTIVDPLSARGIVIFGGEKPVVICAVDFIAISNEGHDAWRAALAEAAGTDDEHVTVHALHQHDGPRCDFMAEHILAEHGLGGKRHDVDFLRDAIQRTAEAARVAVAAPRRITHIGAGEAPVEKVASNRRILGADGKVKIVRFSRSTDPEAIAAPVGTIDPFVKSISFWNESEPLAVLTYYATHPQSHYGEGDVTCEFVGLARNARESALGVPHIHFTGAAGNIAAGKYNDGSPEMRPVLAARLEAGMRAAWASTEKSPISASDLRWRTQAVKLPLAPHLDEATLRATLADPAADEKLKYPAASKLAWIERGHAGHAIDVTALRLGKVWLLHLPAESFVEYQLAAQRMRSDSFVCTAAYGNGAPGYIGTEIAYKQGGYETGENASLVAPTVEKVLMDAITSVLND